MLPRSRQATTPAESRRFALRRPSQISRAVALGLTSMPSMSEPMRWTWQSMRPGVTTPSSGVRTASAGQATSLSLPTARSLPSSASRAKFSMISRPLKSLRPV